MAKKAQGKHKERVALVVLILILGAYYFWNFGLMTPGSASDAVRLRQLQELAARDAEEMPITSSTTARDRLERLRQLQQN